MHSDPTKRGPQIAERDELSCVDCLEPIKGDDVYRLHPSRQAVCENCSSNYVWCGVCGEDQHEDDHCRHVFWDRVNGAGWIGSGGGDVSWDYYREHVATVAARLTPEARTALASALRRHSYSFQLAIPTIGSCSVFVTLNKEWRHDVAKQVAALQYVEDIDEVFIGSNWLLSLQAGRTWKQDLMTARWIEETL